jgi:hypothetical protein
VTEYEARAEFFRTHRNAERIYAQGTLIVRGRIPAAVRKELMSAVKSKMIGRLPKDGLKPEVFFDPRHTNLARKLQADEAVYSIDCIRKCIA